MPFSPLVDSFFRSSVEAVVEAIISLERGTPPSLASFQGHAFLQQVSSLLPFFFKHTVQQGETDACVGDIVYGEKAVRMELAHLTDQVAKGEKVSLGQVEPVNAFQWLLSAGDKEKLQKMNTDSQSKSTLPGSLKQPEARNFLFVAPITA